MGGLHGWQNIGICALQMLPVFQEIFLARKELLAKGVIDAS